MDLKQLKNTPDPLPFMKYNGYEAFKNGQIGFTSKFLFSTIIFILKYRNLRPPNMGTSFKNRP